MSYVGRTSSGAPSANSFSAMYSSQRLTGLLSGLDTDALVEAMTSLQQSRIYKTQQLQTRQSWLEDAWRSVQDTIRTFQNTYVSATGSSSMLKSSTYYSYKVTSDSSSSAVSLSASSATETGAYSVKVERLAQNASISSSNISAKGTTEISASNTAKLSELKFANSLQFVGDKIAFSINGRVFTFSSDTTLQSMINTINNDETANVTIKYSRLTNGFTITADSGGANSRIVIKNLIGNAFGTNSAFGIPEGTVSSIGTFVGSNDIIKGINPYSALSDLSFAKDLTFDENGAISFSINGETFSFSKNIKLQDMLTAINENEAAGVTMTYDPVMDGFTITSDSGVTIKNISGNAFGINSAFGIAETSTRNSADAVAVINGVTVTRSSNEFTIDNVTYRLNAVTAGTANETINFMVTRDYSATIEAISAFVDAFNKMIKTLKDLVNEKDYSADYPPLTDRQEAEMTEAQIEAWNKKAKSGLLRNNTALMRFITNLKNAFYSSLGGTGRNMTNIGITTASYFDSNAGEIVVNKSALEEALAKDPEKIVAMFTGGSSEAAPSEQGLMYKLRNILYNFNNTVKTSISKVETKISDYDKEIKGLQERLDEAAERYYRKFTAMETALSRLNMQNMYISQMFGRGNG